MSNSPNQINKESQFQDLMLHRIHDILLVSSTYDAFILEEDGRLTEQILHEYLGMNLSYAPRVWQANTATYAIDLLSRRSVDLIIVMLRISDMNVVTFCNYIKKKYNKPIILLAFDESEINHLSDLEYHFVDNIFVWTGNASVFPAIIKHVEDRKNLKRDTRKGDVRSIIYIEDTPRYYSSILPLIYREVLFHTKQLIDKSLNNTQRLLHMRGRPKVLLARDYETAEKYFKQYKNNILGIISDIRFPKNGILYSNAGILFAKYVYSIEKSMPVLLSTTEEKFIESALEITPNVLNKNSPTLFSDLRDFIINNFGFGDFTFKMPDGDKIGKVSNIDELLEFYNNIPLESLDFHASNNHFSNWLAARGEFQLANQFRKLKSSDFGSLSERRNYHINLIKNSQFNNVSFISEFTPKAQSSHLNFMRIGSGSLGGKARGLAFAHTHLNRLELSYKYQNIKFRVPRVVAICTDEFDNFMDVNELWEIALSIDNNEDLEKVFLQAKLSEKLIEKLNEFLREVKFPLAVRSSSLLEDSQYQPLAGMYSTFMLPNCHKSDTERLNQLCKSIKLVFASTFFQEPKTLMEAIVHRHEEEKMAVLIMEMIGQKHDQYYYPSFSGVAQSFNYYPISYMQREEGISFVALGLGKTIVDGEKSLRFSPSYPNLLPQFYSIKSIIANSQNTFYALNLNNGDSPLENGEISNLDKLLLNDAEEHGTLKCVGSVICDEDNIVRDSLNNKGKRIITFSPILKYEIFPLSQILIDILKFGQESMGCPVEIEYAVNIYNDSNISNEFCLLQIKPMVFGTLQDSVIQKDNKEKDILCKSDIVLGDGVCDSIYNIIYVDVDTYDRSFSNNISREIEFFNQQLGSKKPYLLIGPGRWGTADPWLGIPVNWKQISFAKTIVELGIDEGSPEPSFGSHFFQNVTSLRVGYFTIQNKSNDRRIDTAWLKNQSVKQKTKFIRWIELDTPLHININGSIGEGTILKPQKELNEKMNEEESSGI